MAYERNEVTPEEAYHAWLAAGRSKRSAAVELGCSRHTVRRRLAEYEEQTGQTVCDEIQEGFEREQESRQLALKIQKQESVIKDLRRELARANEQLLSTDEVRRFVLKVHRTAPSPPTWVSSPGSLKGVGDNVPHVMLSDTHWAERVKPSQVFGLNHYDMTEGALRLQYFANNTVFLLRENLAPRPYPGLVIGMFGDMLSGEIHQELTETNEEYVMPALVDLYDNLRAMIMLLADEFGYLFCPCVIGNHGRTTKKPAHKDQVYRNFDWLLYHLIADWFADDPRVEFLIGDDDEITYTVNGHRYRATHGAQFKGGQGFIGALAPITRGEHKKRIAAYSQRRMYDTLLLAHFHQCIWRPRTVVNGSVVGYNEFASDNSFEFELPKQMMWLTDPVYGKVSPQEVFCVDPKDYDMDVDAESFNQAVV